MRLPVWLAALCLSACSFSSQAPFFDAGDGAYPFADGARFDWIEPFPDGERYDLTFTRTGEGYSMREAAHPEEPSQVLFVAIEDTPEEDYIAQVQLEPGQLERAYAFVWRAGPIFRVITNPGGVEPGSKPLSGAGAYCHWQAYSECQVASAADLLALYRATIYPRFVAGQDLPGAYTLLVPHELRMAPATHK